MLRTIDVIFVQNHNDDKEEFKKTRVDMYHKFINSFENHKVDVRVITLNNTIDSAIYPSHGDHICTEVLKKNALIPIKRYITILKDYLKYHKDYRNLYVIFNKSDLETNSIEPHVKAIYNLCQCYELNTFLV